jgi:hypothetical protein
LNFELILNEKKEMVLLEWAKIGQPNQTGPAVPGLVAHLAETGEGIAMAQGGGGAGRNLVNWRHARVREEALEGLRSVGDLIRGAGR